MVSSRRRLFLALLGVFATTKVWMTDEKTPLVLDKQGRVPLLGLCMVALWVLAAVSPMATRCLLTRTRCTRWGPDGTHFAYPLTSTAYQLIFASVALSPSMMRGAWRSVVAATAPAGVIFGLKYGVAHLALQRTPASVYTLVHCSTIIFIVIASRLLLGERLESRLEVWACVGVAVGTAVAATEQVESVGVSGLLWTLLDCALAGALVATLRRAVLTDTRSYLRVTCVKTGIGALAVLPFALVFEDQTTMNSGQVAIFVVSSTVVLLYHANFTVVCSLSPGVVIGVIEALKPIPAFALTALVQGVPSTSATFWVGSSLVFFSALVCKIARGTRRQDVPVGNLSNDKTLLLGATRGATVVATNTDGSNVHRNARRAEGIPVDARHDVSQREIL